MAALVSSVMSYTLKRQSWVGYTIGMSCIDHGMSVHSLPNDIQVKNAIQAHEGGLGTGGSQAFLLTSNCMHVQKHMHIHRHSQNNQNYHVVCTLYETSEATQMVCLHACIKLPLDALHKLCQMFLGQILHVWFDSLSNKLPR